MVGALDGVYAVHLHKPDAVNQPCQIGAGGWACWRLGQGVAMQEKTARGAVLQKE
jgi:hypothetical protein